MVVLVNRAKMTTATTGTGTITLGSADTGYQTFADAGVADGETIRYVVEDGNDWELGYGTYTASGTTLTRNVSESSNADSALNLTGAAVVFVGAVAKDAGYTIRKTTTYTAKSGEHIIADTNGGVWTLTLPASPIAGDTVRVSDGDDWSTNNLTIGRNASTIAGDAADMTMDIGGVSVDFVYDGTTWQIYAQSGVGGDAVTLTGTQTLTNKTLDLDSNTLTGTLAEFNTALQSDSFVSLTGTETLTNKTITSPAISDMTLTGSVVEDIYVVTGTTPAIEPANGTIQTWTLSGNSTPTDSLVAGESVTLMIDDGTAYTITWTSLVDEWIGGSAPTLATTGYSVVALWKVSTTVYANALGDLS